MGHDTNISYCQIMISDNIFDEMQQKWVPSDDPVFSLTLMLFHIQANDYYTSLDQPDIFKELSGISTRLYLPASNKVPLT